MFFSEHTLESSIKFMPMLEMDSFSVHCNMQSLKDSKQLDDNFSRDLESYINGFCRACQINFAVDNDIDPKGIIMWFQKVLGVQWVVQDIKPLQVITVIVNVSFLADEGENILELPYEAAAEILKAAVFSFLHSYPLFN